MFFSAILLHYICQALLAKKQFDCGVATEHANCRVLAHFAMAWHRNGNGNASFILSFWVFSQKLFNIEEFPFPLRGHAWSTSSTKIYVLQTKRRLGIEIIENTCSSVSNLGRPSASIRCLSETPIRNGFVRRRSNVVNILSIHISICNRWSDIGWQQVLRVRWIASWPKSCFRGVIQRHFIKNENPGVHPWEE